jgi:glycosyltransferase involved in cell wall biosynthesis
MKMSLRGRLLMQNKLSPRKDNVAVIKGYKQVVPSMQVIIAAWNEEEGIGLTVAEIMDTLDCPRVLVVDGRSTDRTIEVAKSLGAEVLLQDGLGKGDAVAKGLANIDPGVDYIVLTDADYTYPAEYVPEMIRILDRQPEVGMVCGNRFIGYEEKTALSSVFYIGNRIIAFAHNLLNGITLNDPLTGLRVVRAGILRGWNVKSKGFDVEVELNHHVERKGFDIVEVPIRYRERLGEKKLGVKNGLEIMKRIMLETTY